MKLAKHAADLAVKLHQGFKDAGFAFLYDHETNQQLPVFTKEQFKKLSETYSFDHFADVEDGKIATRFCTSWATKEEDVEQLLAAVREL